MADPDFTFDRDALVHAVELMATASGGDDDDGLVPLSMPETGLGGRATLKLLAPLILGGASRLGDATAMAHMDPPTPWITLTGPHRVVRVDC